MLKEGMKEAFTGTEHITLDTFFTKVDYKDFEFIHRMDSQ